MNGQQQETQQAMMDEWQHMNSYGRPMQEPNMKLTGDVISELMKLKTELDEFEGSLRGLKKIPILGQQGQIKGHQFIPVMLRCIHCSYQWEYNHITENNYCEVCITRSGEEHKGRPVRLLNEIGVNNVMQNLRIQTIPKIFGFTYLDAKQIERIIIAFSLEVCSDLFDNMDEYELSEKDFQTVHSQVVEIKNAVLQRSLEGFIPKILQTMVFKEEKSIQDMNQNKVTHQRTMGEKSKSWF